MFLWAQEMLRYRSELSSIAPSKRLALAYGVMEWTLDEMGNIHTDVVRGYLQEGMLAARRDVDRGMDKLELSDEMLDAWNEVDDQADEPGTTHMMSAILACADSPEGLSGEVLYGILCFCYEALRERQAEEIDSLEGEMASAQCVGSISFQRAAVEDALASR